MKTRNRTPAERAVIFASLLGELSLEQTRKLLKDSGFGELPDSSWEMLNRAYLPKFRSNPKLLGESIYSPKPISELDDW